MQGSKYKVLKSSSIEWMYSKGRGAWGFDSQKLNKGDIITFAGVKPAIPTNPTDGVFLHYFTTKEGNTGAFSPSDGPFPGTRSPKEGYLEQMN